LSQQSSKIAHHFFFQKSSFDGCLELKQQTQAAFAETENTKRASHGIYIPGLSAYGTQTKAAAGVSTEH